ncbi:FG-GAP-like repeat-containing protein [uncultured Ruegeria sp.]|uniref:FG-GAP-like repeat-containing protein n=1 Tax=uncultured Ruegeria sp. TaxID=259304 RepID=UPI00260F516B|nr:FG-GAP-like repeat-containing protein [uncultured Ruegeria sp.]
MPNDPIGILGFVGDLTDALNEGSTHRDDGSVDFWSNGTVVGRTNAKSNYSDDFLDNYGTVDADGYASASIGGHVRALGDWLGFDGTFGLDGRFSKPGEGRQNDPNKYLSHSPDGEPYAESNHINTGGTNGGKDPGGNSGGSSSGGSGGNSGRSGRNSGTGLSGEDRPIILDLDGNGVQITELSNSTVFVDSSGDGLQNLTAWAAAGNGVLFYDADGDGTISETREYVFTEWDPTATSDIEALRSVFDANGDGVFDANDEAWSDFKVLVTQPDGSLVAMTLDELGITSIDLTADATNIELPDGSVITGTTTFTKSDGSTGTVADTMLVSDTASYRIEESESFDTSGTRTHVQTGYAADGTIAFVITSVTTANGASITNSYDNNGDGVVDRMQFIETVTNPDGSKSETVTNKVGSDFTTGILVSETKTTTSADGNTVTIERDSTGGGWFDQVEMRTTHADDSMTIVTTDRDPNGGVIRSSTETVSADGLTRTDAIDEDGDGLVDLTITHSIVINADGSRSETIEHFNQDGSLRSSVTESVSVDGRTKSIARDLDGDGDVDVQEELDILVNADGSTNSTLTVKNGDGSVRSTTTQNQSEDALTKTTTVDQDGDGDADLTTVEATVIHADGSRETETTLTNTDASVRAKTKVTLGSDQVSSETWVDHNQDGIFQATDLSRSVTVDSTSGERTTTSWTRNADGSFSAQSVSVSSEDGLVVTIDVDADGDGDTDLSTSDVTVENTDGSSTRTLTERAQDGALKGEQVVTTSADGLMVSTVSDIDGDGNADGKSVLTQVSNGDGSTLQTTTRHAGDETTLLGETTVSQSADRRLTITTSDANGDGATDTTLRSEKHADGSMTELETRFSADGTTLFTRQTDVSEDDLTVTVATDLDGDGDTDVTSVQATVLNADGGHTTTSTIRNDDDSLRSQMVTTISDDGLVTTTSEDTDGDGVSERSVTATTVLNADGLRTTTEDVQASDDSLLSRSETLVSDDGLTVETRADNDGDLSADIVTTRVTTLNDDGSTTVTAEVRDVTGASDELRSQGVTTTSDDGRDVFETTDINGDGQVDMRVHRVVGDDGQITVTETRLSSDGSTQSQMVTETSDTGLESTTRYDANGDGLFERSESGDTVLNADGSTTRTVEESTQVGTVYKKSVTGTSRDGWISVTREDWDNDGDDDLTTSRVYDLAANGVETTIVTRTAANGTTLSTDTTVVSADKHTSTRSIDADGNGVNDQIVTSSVAGDGSRSSQTQSFDSVGNLIATRASSVSSDGLTTTTRMDWDGDGTDELVTTATTTLAADGSQSTTTNYADGSDVLMTGIVATSSDDGLQTSWSVDFDGDGITEFVTTGATTFEADGDVVTAMSTTNGAGAALGRVTTTTSGNGLSTTAALDLNGDGTTDLTSSLVTDGNRASTQNHEWFGSNGARVHNVQTVTSADGRTKSTSTDLNGDGATDRVVTTQIQSDHSVTTSLLDLNDLGYAGSAVYGHMSANGHVDSYSFDVNGDGVIDFVRSVNVSYDADGNRITERYESHGGRTSYGEQRELSKDGLTETYTQDWNLDGHSDLTQVSQIVFNTDGSESSSSVAWHANGERKSGEFNYITADGRAEYTRKDYDGDGVGDRTVTFIRNADGSTKKLATSYDANGSQRAFEESTTSMDGLITTTEIGTAIQTTIRSAADADSYVFTHSEGTFVSAAVTQSGYASSWWASRESYLEDVNGDGFQDLIVIGGDDAVSYIDTTLGQADGSFGATIRTDAGYAGSWWSAKDKHVGDVNGDGLADLVMFAGEDSIQEVHTFLGQATGGFAGVSITHAGFGGSWWSSREKHLGDVNGDGYSDLVMFTGDDTLSQVSVWLGQSDGRFGAAQNIDAGYGGNWWSSREKFLGDVNGDGLADLVMLTGADHVSQIHVWMGAAEGGFGGVALTESAYAGNWWSTKSKHLGDVNGDGLADLIFITGDDNQPETQVLIGQSDGTFGSVAVTASDYGGSFWASRTQFLGDVNGDGLADLTMLNGVDGTPLISTYLADKITVSHLVDAAGIETWTMTQTSNAPTPLVYSARLDAQSKARVLEEAARLYDTLLDRALETDEQERLVKFITNSELDLEALANEIMQSLEFAKRYPDQTNFEFLNQLYMNTFGRGATMRELIEDLSALTNETKTRAVIATERSESAEHIVVGNTGQSTINYDLELNAAQVERPLDLVYLRSLVEKMFDVAYDRIASSALIEQMALQLRNGEMTKEELAASLISADSKTGSTLAGLSSNADFTARAFLNGLGRSPTEAEAHIWTYALDNGWITRAELVVALATSTDHEVSGIVHGTALYAPVVMTGSSDDDVMQGGHANDVLDGDDGTDYLFGLDGTDTLRGGIGNDVLDGGAGGDELDGGTGWDTASYGASQAGITIDLSNGSASGGDAAGDTLVSIESVRGSKYDDVILGSDISNGLYAGAGNDYVEGRQGDDFIFLGSGDDKALGQEGDDTIRGDEGNDTLHGGAGNDTLFGGYGTDIIGGDAGDDELTGGFEADDFFFNAQIASGDDVIMDFEDGIDRLVFKHANFSDLSISTYGVGTRITWANGSVTLKDVLQSDITEDDFAFI